MVLVSVANTLEALHPPPSTGHEYFCVLINPESGEQLLVTRIGMVDAAIADFEVIQHNMLLVGTGGSLVLHAWSKFDNRLSEGREIVCNQSGVLLSKTVYDRLGRVTHRFTLAKDNDSAYGDADDVTGDYVLVEYQTTYESGNSDNVLMEASISRHHDDLSTGNTGALDTNADGNLMVYTAAEVKGRIQISASWFDDLDRVVDSVEYG